MLCSSAVWNNAYKVFFSRLLVLSTSQTEDKATIIDLERRLKKEVEARNRVDAELREHRHAITNAFTQEELAGLRKKVQEQHHEIEKMREQLKEQQRSWEHRHQREVSNGFLLRCRCRPCIKGGQINLYL